MLDDPLRNPAPVRIEGTVEIAASPDRVWSVLTRMERWHRWHRGVHFAFLRGELVEGTRLDWRAEGMRIRSVLREVVPAERIAWSSRAFGAVGYHRWSLERLADGGTRLRSEEVWDGILVRVLRRTLRRTLTRSREEWLAALQRVAEEGGEGAFNVEQGR